MMDYNGNDVYKGLFYNVDNEDEQQFYEGGAHFSYIELYEELEKIVNNERNNNDEKKKKLIVNLFNLNHHSKSRNLFIENDFSNSEKINIKKNKEEKNSEKKCIKNNSKNVDKKKKLTISSFTINEKKIQNIINLNISTKKNKEKRNEDKIFYSRPISLNNKHSIKKKMNIRNEYRKKKHKKRSISQKKLSFSYQNIYQLSSSSNSYNIKSGISNNKNYSPIIYKERINNKNQVLSANSNIYNTTTIVKENMKIKQDYYINSLNKNKSRNLNSQNETLNMKNQNKENLKNKRKCSKTFHNNNKEKSNSNKINTEEEISIQIRNNKTKDKPHSKDKTIRTKKIITYNDITDYSNNSKKKINKNLNSLFHHPKNIYSKLQKLAFSLNSKKLNIYNIKPINISLRKSIKASYNINTNISSRTKISKNNKTSITQFSINKQMQNLQIHYSKNSTSNTLNSNSNSNKNYFKNIINKNLLNENSKNEKIQLNINNQNKLINNSSFPKKNKTNILICKLKKGKEKKKYNV